MVDYIKGFADIKEGHIHWLLSFNGLVKGVLHLLPKISIFCALSQNNQQLFEK